MVSFAAVVRPVLDRVYLSIRVASRPGLREVYGARGLEPGFETSYYYGLLAGPVPGVALADAMSYAVREPTVELAQGVVVRGADGSWALTELGREVSLANLRVIGEAAERLWSARPIATMPGLGALDELNALAGRLLVSGRVSGGAAFLGLAPGFEPEGASAAARLSVRLGALRHHRADAHRAAWRGAGLTAAGIREMGAGAEREAIEVETDRLDEPVYGVLDAGERLRFLGLLGSLADGLGAA
ncbi:hypothetical protein [Glycomyces sp. NPDC047010]|uniref:hypothetical protein n=1 Tax=Glycomyces sp. NPDC047010 TaxID=3155023 RepID=UPI00340F98CC